MLILEDITERKKNTGNGLIRREGSIIEHHRKEKSTTRMESSSRDNVTIVRSTATERQNAGGTEIKVKINNNKNARNT